MLSRRAMLLCSLAAGGVAGLLPVAQGLAQPLAPEFVGIAGWLNVAAPPTIAGLRGKVVLVDFWTYSCINCRRTIPYLNRWQAQYGSLGLQVISIHTPEFGFEHAAPNVADAVRALGIRYPVGQDNAGRTWSAWGNEAWPAFYLVDRAGRIVLVREGEDHARELEAAIRALLGLAPAAFAGAPGDDPDLSGIGTAEIYFGAQHPTPQDRAQHPRLGEATYAFPSEDPRPGMYQLDGTWDRAGEALVLRSARGAMRVRFHAAKFHLVAADPISTRLSVRVDGRAAPPTEVQQPTLYTLFEGTRHVDRMLLLEADRPDLALYSATFG